LILLIEIPYALGVQKRHWSNWWRFNVQCNDLAFAQDFFNHLPFSCL